MKNDGTVVEEPEGDVVHVMAEPSAKDGDPDPRPMTPEELARAPRIPRVRTMRRALALTQQEFASRFHIPIPLLQDWEAGRSEPDETAKAYLKVIATDPESVIRALSSSPG